MEQKRYIEYELTSDILCIGERTKKGTYKPSIKTIPYSTITGALKDAFNIQGIHAIGKFDSEYLKNVDKFRQIHVYSPRYVFEDVARVPLKIEFLSDVRARVYVFLENEDPHNFIERNKNLSKFDIRMGAFKSKGFGKCDLKFVRIIDNPDIETGKLDTRIPEKYLEYFKISEVKKPVYGYLFEPVTIMSGKYIRALFEGSIVKGCDFLIGEVDNESS